MASASTLAAISRRLEKLEQAEAGSLMPRYIVASFHEALPRDDADVCAATCRGERFTREANESLDEFFHRIASGAKAGAAALIFLE